MQNTYNNREVCQHKIFKRDCEICGLADELDSLQSTESKENAENVALKKELFDLKEKAQSYYICAADVISGDPCCETVNRYGHAESELCEALGITPMDYNNKEKP